MDAFFGDVAKWVTEIDSADRIPEIISRAFATAVSGRPGPVVIALPEDMLRELSDAEATHPAPIAEAAPSEASLQQALSVLKAAKRPLVLVGGGGWTAEGKKHLQMFANRNNLPVAVAFRYQDLIDNASAAYVGDAGVGMTGYLKELISSSDTILALNVRLGESTTEGWSLLEVPRMTASLVHSHASDLELNKIYQADVAIHAGPNETAKALADAGTLGDWSDWRDPARASYVGLRTTAKVQGAVDMVAISQWLDKALETDAIITNGAGNFAVWPSKFLTYTGQRRLLAPQSGAMGAGVPAAIAAKTVDRNRQVVCFAGDGDFQMSIPELGAAAQDGIQPIILLLNNGMYGTIRHIRKETTPAE